jgi:hypothetical protein
MPVYNALPYLDQAIESILAQSFRDFEFLILDDGSTDGSTKRLKEWATKDERIRLLEEKENLGPAMSSQRVARAASAPIVARMDADDVSHPDRLARQFEILSENADAGVVGCLCEIIHSDGRKIRGPEPWRLVRRSPFVPFAHGAMMYRQSVFDRVGGYRSECVYWEDLDLVTRMSAVCDVLVMPTALYQVRQSSGSTRFNAGQEQFEESLDLMYRCLDRLAQGKSYEDLLGKAKPADGKIDPRAYISLGSVTLWAGQRPHLFKRLLNRGELTGDFRSASALVWTAWASLSPTTLRSFLRLLFVARNSFAASRIHKGEPVVWTPGAGATAA